MTNTLSEIDEYNTHKKWWFRKVAHLAKNMPRGYLTRADLSDF